MYKFLSPQGNLRKGCPVHDPDVNDASWAPAHQVSDSQLMQPTKDTGKLASYKFSTSKEMLSNRFFWFQTLCGDNLRACKPKR